MIIDSKLFKKISLKNNSNYNEYTNIILLLISIVFIVIYSSIKQENRVHIADILTSDMALYSTIIVIIIASYYNLLIGFTLCVIYIIMILPFFAKNNKSGNITEGFNNGLKEEYENDKKKVDKDIEHLISAFKGKGPRTKELMNDIKKKESKKKRENAFNSLDTKNDDEVEQFEETELSIPRRKFNPNDEFDNNLKMVMGLCDDIKKRITYKYEENDYLKKYISTKIQQIIDLLELSKD